MDRKKLYIAVATILWSGFVVAAYFVVQKPIALRLADHLLSLVWTLTVTALLVFNALTLGTFTVKQFIADVPDGPSTLALAGGIGLGELGLLGFILAATGASQFWILFTAQILILGWSIWKGILRPVAALIKNSITEIKSSSSLIPAWMKWAALLALILTFLMTLLPPADAFDALLYHLTVPAHWLQDGGIRAYDFPHYWFPDLVEGVFFWGLGLGSDIVSQQIHFAWALFAVLLIWDWTRGVWDHLTAWWAVTLMISIPSLLLLASWAYTDMALIFFGVAMLYTLSHGREQNDTRWWRLSAISAGMAMGVKYTSFVMPVTAILLICAWKFHEKKELFTEVVRFTAVSLVTGFIWYLRNWIWMGNPIYPFVFGGRYWDPFRAAWFAGAGTGSGWDLKALALLPLTITLGYQDINFIDADIGPLLLLTLPFALWMLARAKHDDTPRKTTLTAIGFFAAFSAAFWVYGYITSHNLWQTRLLLPALVPFVIPAAVGIIAANSLNTRQLRLYFIVSIIAAASIYTNLLDTCLTVIARNPLSIATGITTSQNYLERYQPAYTHAIQMVSQTSLNSRIYLLFEPRSYEMDRKIQPDPILDNFSHDVYLYKDPETIVKAWQLRGYTHVLLNVKAADAVLESRGGTAILNQTMNLLKPVSTSPDEDYELFEIPVR